MNINIFNMDVIFIQKGNLSRINRKTLIRQFNPRINWAFRNEFLLLNKIQSIFTK